jgi:hypothetical protein
VGGFSPAIAIERFFLEGGFSPAIEIFFPLAGFFLGGFSPATAILLAGFLAGLRAFDTGRFLAGMSVISEGEG